MKAEFVRGDLGGFMSDVLHGANFVFISFGPGEEAASGHTTGVLVFGGDEWRSVWR